MKKQITVSILTGLAVLISLNLILTRLLSVTAGPVRVGFGFLPIAFGSMLYGTAYGAVAAFAADILGAVLAGNGYWPGFGLSAVLYGITYGLFLYRKEKSVKNITLCVLLQAVLLDSLLGAFWYYHYIGMPYITALTARGLEAIIMVPVKILMLHYLWRLVGTRLEK